MLCLSVTCAVRSANRTPCAGHVEFHTRARPENPSVPNPFTSLPFVRRGIGNIHRVRSRTGFHSRKRARGGLVCCTARTSRSPPCKPGVTIPITATAATRPLSLCRCRRLHSTHAHLRVTTLTHHARTFTPGHAVPCSRMPTVISLSYSDLTHAVPLTHRASLTRTFSFTHTILLTHAGTLTRGVSLILGRSLTHGCSHTRAVSLAHAASSTRGAPFTHGVLGSTNASWHTRHHTTHTRGHFHTRGLTHTRGLIHTRGLFRTWGRSHTLSCTHAMRALQHAFHHAHIHTPRHHTRRDNHTRNHTGDSHHL